MNTIAFEIGKTYISKGFSKVVIKITKRTKTFVFFTVHRLDETGNLVQVNTEQKKKVPASCCVECVAVPMFIYADNELCLVG